MNVNQTTGRRRSATQGPVTSPASMMAAGVSPIFGSHDEPFVVDNGPASLKLGRKRGNEPKNTGDPKRWKRHAGSLKALAVFRYAASGELDEIIEVVDLVKTETASVLVTLQDRATMPTKTDVIALKPDATAQEEIEITSGQNLSISGTHDLKYPAGYLVYIAKVEGRKADNTTTSFEIPIPFNSGAPTKVFVGFTR